MGTTLENGSVIGQFVQNFGLTTAKPANLSGGVYGATGIVGTFTPTASQQTLGAGGGAVNITSYLTVGASDAGGDAWTLADATVIGQLKKIVLGTDGGGDAVLTPTNLAGGTTITFNDANDYVVLAWDGTDWNVIENVGCTVA